MSLTSYRAAPPRDSGGIGRPMTVGIGASVRSEARQRRAKEKSSCDVSVLGRPGSDLLSQALRRSTIGAEGFNGRVRNGIGFCPLARATRPAKHRAEDGRRRTDDRSSEPSGIRHDTGLEQPTREHLCPPSSVRRPLGRALTNESDQAERAISTGKLRALPRFHLRPIDVVVFHGSSGRTRFEVGFPLRCFQRLSRPHIATLQCGWRHNRSTRGASIPVLSY